LLLTGCPYSAAAVAGGFMKAPKIHRIGKKIPRKTIHRCRFLSVMSPSVKATRKYKIPAPIPIPHHMIPPWIRLDVDPLLDPPASHKAGHHPMRVTLELRPLDLGSKAQGRHETDEPEPGEDDRRDHDGLKDERARQLIPVVITSPINGPAAAPIPPSPLITPKAQARLVRSVNQIVARM
jgi:hypothetical protein